MWLSILPTVLKTGASIFANRQKAKVSDLGMTFMIDLIVHLI